MSRLTYERKDTYNAIRSSQTTTRYVVKLDGKRVGTIKQVGMKWQYFPKGWNIGGDKFTHLADCKASLEVE